jgi:hypothetical protein
MEQELTYDAAPPQPSKQELAAAEAQTVTDIKWTAASAVVLYFGKYLTCWGKIERKYWLESKRERDWIWE